MLEKGRKRRGMWLFWTARVTCPVSLTSRIRQDTHSCGASVTRHSQLSHGMDGWGWQPQPIVAISGLKKIRQLIMQHVVATSSLITRLATIRTRRRTHHKSLSRVYNLIMRHPLTKQRTHITPRESKCS